ncbi:MAG: glycosyltransferase [Acidimicrobiales bacterium]|jgi:glycosyltransferase involved in cell wall biosynthesis
MTGTFEGRGATWIGQLELANALRAEAVIESDRAFADWARVLVRLHHEPLGFVSVPSPGGVVDVDRIGAMAWRQFELEIRKHLSQDRLSCPDGLPLAGLGGWEACAADARAQDAPDLPISVVVCTRDRPKLLWNALSTLRQVDYGAFEVLVVDNAPSSTETRTCVEEFVRIDPRFRYLTEPRAGVAWARNLGLAEAQHDWVAFADDDVLVDPWWLRGVARGICRDTEVACVTGLVPPASLLEPAQRYFDERMSWTSSLQPRVYDLDKRRGEDALYPFSAGIFGTGANSAFDRRFVQRVGGFDTTLGAGSRTKGGEDLDMFLRVVLAGRALAYEPAAVIWHIHRSDSAVLKGQMYDYGLGLTAFLAKWALKPSTTWQVLKRVPPGAFRIASLLGRARVSTPAGPRPAASVGYKRAELRGMIAGPFVYCLARRAARTIPNSQA